MPLFRKKVNLDGLLKVDYKHTMELYFVKRKTLKKKYNTVKSPF